jgi:hypothetical protein
MQEQLAEDLGKIMEILHGMRTKMRNSQKYSGKGAVIDKFDHALRLFAHEIDPAFVFPYIPVKKDEDEWLDCRC